MGFFILKDMYFLLKAKGLNDMDIFLLINLIRVID
jgi:hypothetical protein